jgi:dTDP-4-amino-4,6-dideoxygalactose transaminase
MKFAGAIGDLGCFPSFPAKLSEWLRRRGLVTTGNRELAAKLRMLRMHGESTKYHHQVTGINSRLDSFQAAVLSVKLRYLEAWCEQRIQRAQIYHRIFTESGLLGENTLRIPPQTANRSHVFNNYVVSVRRRDDLKQFLAEQNSKRSVLSVPLHLQACFAGLGYKRIFLSGAGGQRSSSPAALSRANTGAAADRGGSGQRVLPPVTLRFTAAVIKSSLPQPLPDP